VNHESILDLITTRETIATAQVEQLREQITALTEQLAAIETELTDLETTRGTLLRLTGVDDPTLADATLASTAYQQILAVFATTGSGLRAKDICHALAAMASMSRSVAARYSTRPMLPARAGPCHT
jgi:hypothetical protein